MQPLSIFPSTLTNRTLESWGATNWVQWIKANFNVFCAMPKLKDSGLFLLEDTVTSVVYIHMLEKLIIPILVKQGSNDMPIWQAGAPPHFHITVRMSLTECSTEMNWQMQPGTWPHQFHNLTWPDFFSWGVHNVHIPPLPTTLQELWEWIQATYYTNSYTHYTYTCVKWTFTHVGVYRLCLYLTSIITAAIS
jgi:hypothetical protein